MSLESDLMQPDRQGDETPPPVTPEPEAQAAAPPVDEEAALDQLIEEQSINLPDGTDKLVPLSALTTVREKLSAAKGELKTAKEGSAKQADLEEKVAQLQQTITQWQPYVQAYTAALQQAQHQPAQAPPEDTAELEELAKDLDFYKADGNLDLDKARRMQSRITKQAEKQADAKVAPWAQQSTAQQASHMRERAKATVFPSGEKADPEMVDLVWSQLDPALTATEQGAKFAVMQALGMSRGLGKKAPAGQRGPDGKFLTQQPAQELPPPLHTEKAGGRDTPGDITMTDVDRKAAKAMGITDKEYMESAKSMPRGAR